MVLKQYRAVDRLVHWMEKAAEKENVQSVWTERFFCYAIAGVSSDSG